MYTYNEDTKEVKNGTFEVIEEEKECYDFYDATCTEPKTCKICSKPSGEELGHAEADSNGLCTRCHQNIAYKTATLSFSDISNRTTFTNEQQIWQENGITVVNNKHEYTNNIGDYSNPARFYKSTELIIQHEKNIIEIEVNANSSDYATVLKDSIGNIATVLLDDKNVNITLETPCVELKFVSCIFSKTKPSLLGIICGSG